MRLRSGLGTGSLMGMARATRLKPEIQIALFGRFSFRSRSRALFEHAPQRLQELVAYLLIHHDRLHRREALAGLLWEDASNSRKYLRQSLWMLQKELQGISSAAGLIQQTPSSVQLNLSGHQDVEVDVLEFENAYRSVASREKLRNEDAARCSRGVDLYRGDLLEGWYRPWCDSERERLQRMYLTLLDRLTLHHQSRSEYETAIDFATKSLQYDPAKERTHRTLMRLLHESGDRTGALRQFERCRAALREELDVEPGDATVALYEQIRSDRKPPQARPPEPGAVREAAPTRLRRRSPPRRK